MAGNVERHRRSRLANFLPPPSHLAKIGYDVAYLREKNGPLVDKECRACTRGILCNLRSR